MAYEMMRIIFLLLILRSGRTSRRSEANSSQDAKLGDFRRIGRWRELFRQDVEAKIVGQGSFGTAMRAKLAPECNSREPVVVKEIDLANFVRKMRMSPRDSIKAIGNELRTQMQLGSHPNIMGIYDYAPRDVEDWTRQVYIMMPEARGGDLDKLYEVELKKNKIDPGVNQDLWARMLNATGMKDHNDRNRLIASIAVDVTRGLKHIHEANLIHMDIKPGNVWASDKGCLRKPMNCKYMIGDFGLATIETEARQITAGTPYFMPPEVGHGSASELLKKYGLSPPRQTGWSKAGDVFSLGLTLFSVISMEAYTTWQDYGVYIMTDTKNVLRKNVAGLSPQLDELISGMLHAEPSKRLTAEKAHELANFAYLRITGREAVIPAADEIPTCVTRCNEMRCCRKHHCSMRKGTCQSDDPRSPAPPQQQEEGCYGHDQAPPEMSQVNRQPRNPELSRASVARMPTHHVPEMSQVSRTPHEPVLPRAPPAQVPAHPVPEMSQVSRRPREPVLPRAPPAQVPIYPASEMVNMKPRHPELPRPPPALVPPANPVSGTGSRASHSVSRPLPAASGYTPGVQGGPLGKGSAVKYRAGLSGNLIDCVVLDTRTSAGASDSVDVKLSCMPDYWLSPYEQKKNLRLA